MSKRNIATTSKDVEDERKNEAEENNEEGTKELQSKLGTGQNGRNYANRQSDEDQFESYVMSKQIERRRKMEKQKSDYPKNLPKNLGATPRSGERRDRADKPTTSMKSCDKRTGREPTRASSISIKKEPSRR